MSGFIQKLRVITLGAAHDLLDKEIDMNSPSALRQYVRDLEDALSKIKNEAANQAGLVRTLTREQGDLRSRIDQSKSLAAKYVQSNPSLARVKASDAVQAEQSLNQNIKQLDLQIRTSQDLDASVARLDAKHSEMVNHVRDLERLDQDTKAREQAARALTAAGSTISGGADLSVDDVRRKMEARNDVATEKLSRAMGSIHVEDDPEHAQAVDELLASLTPPKADAAKQ